VTRVKKVAIKRQSSLRTSPQKNSRFFGCDSEYLITSHAAKQKKLGSALIDISSSLGQDFMQSLVDSNRKYRPQVNSIQGRFADFEREYVEIDELAILKDNVNPYSWAAYAKKDIEGPMRIAEYFLEKQKVPETGSKAEDKLSDSAYYNSFQYGKEAALVPPEGVVSWAEKVNCASCCDAANLRMVRSGCHVYLEIPKGVKIKAGEQLLSFYGEEFFSSKEASFQSRVFINPCDNKEDSADKLTKYPYKRTKVNLNPELYQIMKIDSSTQFSEPNLQRLNSSTVNLPLLAYDTMQKVLPQHEQENITLLHLACWMGDEKKLDILLAKGAYLNQQTKNLGFSPLHFIVMSPHYPDVATKIVWIKRLKKAGASLKLQDHEENSILHHAITSENIEIIEVLIKLDSGVLNLINDDDFDFFLQAIAIGSLEALQVLRPFITSKYLSNYLPDEDDEEEDFEYLKAVLEDLRNLVPDAEFKLIKNFLKALFLEKNRELYTLFQEHFNETHSSGCTIC
jgi:hypothetical protein